MKVILDDSQMIKEMRRNKILIKVIKAVLGFGLVGAVLWVVLVG